MRQPRFVKISSKKSVCFVLFMVVKHKAEFIMERSCQMIETNGKKLFRGEAALALAVLINSFGVVLMLYSGAGILSLMIMRKKFVTSYLFSFAVGFVFSELLDVHELWINVLPSSLAWRIVYFIISYVLICIGIALSNRCQLPIVPTDLFPRELADITKIAYPKIKIGFDVTRLAVTAGLTFFCLGRIDGLGIGTILGIAGDIINKQFYFKSFMSKKQQA
ncbi:Uncharacterised protein [uncultured Ruminococcus sp.]|nr:Uncharacterised protein [uncultured Ruminococcus sp.]